MSHGYQIENVTFLFNSDMSGDVEIVNNETDKSIKIPAEAILQFVANYVACQKIAALEQASYEEILFAENNSK